jgi:hypothetical protein
MRPPNSPEPDRGQRRAPWASTIVRWIGLPISAAAILILANSVDLSAAAGALATADFVPLAGAAALIASRSPW